MRDLLDILAGFDLLAADQMPMALATIVAVEGSSYRRPGARMLIAADGRRFGSISGGCLENDVARRGRQVIDTGTPALCRYETGDDAEDVFRSMMIRSAARRAFLSAAAARWSCSSSPSPQRILARSNRFVKRSCNISRRAWRSCIASAA